MPVRRRGSRGRSFWWGILLPAALVSAGRAGAEEPSAQQRGAELAEVARRLFESGHADQALSLAEEAYQLTRDPIMLYNIARGHEQLGALPEAIVAYRRFLDARPDLEARPAIVQRMATLQHLLDERARADREHQQRIVQLEEEKRRILDRPPETKGPVSVVVGAASVGVGIAAAVAGAALWGVALGRHAAAISPATDGLTGADDESQARSFALAGNILFGAGAAVAEVGGLAALFGSRPKTLDMGPRSVALAPAVAPGWLGLRGGF
jgi:tetratricopeptide (TPR) repeat protein